MDDINNENSLTFNDFIIISRASPAKSLGLGKIKGSLGVNADGDLNILDININEIDPIKDYQDLKKSLGNIEYVIKAGEVVKKDKDLDLKPTGKIFWAEGAITKEDKSIIVNKKKEFYEKYSSIFYNSLKISVEDKYLRKID